MRRQRMDPGTGELVATVVGIVFGLVFLVANREPLVSPWPTVVLVIGLGAAAADVALLAHYARQPGRAALAGPTVLGGRRYGVVVAAEVVALVAGLVVINAVLDRPEYAVAWVAIVVGVHFVGLGVGRSAPIVVLGAVLMALGLLGVVLGALTGSAGVISWLAGVGSGFTLLIAVGLDLRRRLQLARAA